MPSNNHTQPDLWVQSKYAKAMVEWEKEHPRPARRHKKERDPTQLKRPQSAYFFFLADYREAYKVSDLDYPGLCVMLWATMKQT